VSAFIDDGVLVGMKIDVRSPFAVVVNNVDVLSKMLTVVDIALLLEDVYDSAVDSVGLLVDTNV
jgi:hypothetical protein